MTLQPLAWMVALTTAGSVGAGAQAARQPLIDLASSYVSTWVGAFSKVVAEERYAQYLQGTLTRRTLRSDFLLVRYPGAEYWHAFRDVFEVDGKPIRDPREERLARLFLEPAENALRRAEEIAGDGVRYNLRNIGTFNNPLVALFFLQAEYRDRFRFTVEGLDRDLGPTIRSVRFDEITRPTILRQGANRRDLPSRGQVWIDEQTGRVVKTELRFDWPAANSTITTLFRIDEVLQINVPVEVREWYLDRFGGVRGVATYGRFRRFQVETDTQLNK